MHLFNEFVFIGLMLLINAAFAGYEMALASISRARLAILVSKNQKGASDALYMKDHMEASLAVVQLGITLAGAIAAATGGAGVADWLEPYLIATYGLNTFWSEILSLLIFVLPLSVLIIVFAELIPKMIAINHRERVCLVLSPCMKAFCWIAYPFIAVVEKFVKFIVHLVDKKIASLDGEQEIPSLHEFNAAAALARTSRLIGAREEKIVMAAAQLSHRPVSSAMTPLTDISMIAQSASLGDALLHAHMDMHTRFPVYILEGEKRLIKGYINFKDIVAALKLNPENPSIEGIIRPIKLIDEKTSLSAALEIMIHEKAHITIVVNGAQEPVGMITMEDIIEEMTGDIEDEFDRLPNYIHRYTGGWVVGGGVMMKQLIETMGLKEERPDLALSNQRLSDWCRQKVSSLKGGEIIEDGSIKVMVRKLRRKYAGELVVYNTGAKT